MAPEGENISTTASFGRGALRRRCKECGTSAELKVAPNLACECSHLARWAFDPGSDFSEQLFFGEGRPACGSGLGRCPDVSALPRRLGYAAGGDS